MGEGEGEGSYTCHSFRQCDSYPETKRLCQFFGTHYTIGIAEAPELFRVAQVTRGEIVQNVFRAVEYRQVFMMGNTPVEEVSHAFDNI